MSVEVEQSFEFSAPSLGLQVTQVYFAPGDFDPGENELARAVTGFHEGRAQIVVACGKCRDGGAQTSGIDGARQGQQRLHRVDVGGIGVVEGVEEHAVLQWRERPHVDEAGVPALPVVDVVLGSRD